MAPVPKTLPERRVASGAAPRSDPELVCSAFMHTDDYGNGQTFVAAGVAGRSQA